MAAALLNAGDDELLLARKKRCLLNGWMLRKECGFQNQLYEKRLEDGIDEWLRLLRVPRTAFATAQATTS